MKTKAEVTPGTPIEDEVSRILEQLQIDAPPAQKETILKQVQADLHAILPTGQWDGKNSREALWKEFQRVKEEMEKQRTEEATTLAASIRNKQRSK